MAQLHLLLLIHAHQPAGNFPEVLERCYQKAYLPFAEHLLRHPRVRLGMHYSGSLLEWIEHSHPEFFEMLRELVGRGQVEMVGGGFYEPILISIPLEDRIEQIRRLADYIEKHFGRRPTGAWLAERVWEPQLPETLARAGVEYTLVDDIHFLAAGFEPMQLHSSYIAEDQGATVKLIPGLKAMRYLTPFRSVEDNIDFLFYASREAPGGIVAMGDDNEKFGVWPKTHQHCYTDGWLEKYFAALESHPDWLEVTPPGEYVATHAPAGRADLPAASYTEMMEWALPSAARQKFHSVVQEFSGRPDVGSFLRGGIWRSFFSKYAEANLLHKRMLHVSGKVRRLSGSARRGLPLKRAAEAAVTHLLRSQCNDAYWHGVFGGLYAPHLRTELLRELVRAERLADAAEHGQPAYAELARLDYDADGREELLLTSDVCAALWKPSDGGTLAALDFRATDSTLINSLQRRVEVYHSRLSQAPEGPAAAVASIHDQGRAKEEGLEKRLRYDRWPRHCFRLLLFAPEKTWDDYEKIRLEENAAFAAGEYAVTSATPDRVEFSKEGSIADGGAAADAPAVRAEKVVSVTRSPDSFELSCQTRLTHRSGGPLRLMAGIELVINLLAPNEPDRYFDIRGSRHALSLGAAIPASRFRLVDEWQNVACSVEAPDAREFWISPIETVSESEEGFERVYQGSQILAVWPLELPPGAKWSARLNLRVTPARKTS